MRVESTLTTLNRRWQRWQRRFNVPKCPAVDLFCQYLTLFFFLYAVWVSVCVSCRTLQQLRLVSPRLAKLVELPSLIRLVLGSITSWSNIIGLYTSIIVHYWRRPRPRSVAQQLRPAFMVYSIAVIFFLFCSIFAESSEAIGLKFGRNAWIGPGGDNREFHRDNFCSFFAIKNQRPPS